MLFESTLSYANCTKCKVFYQFSIKLNAIYFITWHNYWILWILLDCFLFNIISDKCCTQWGIVLLRWLQQLYKGRWRWNQTILNQLRLLCSLTNFEKVWLVLFATSSWLRIIIIINFSPVPILWGVEYRYRDTPTVSFVLFLLHNPTFAEFISNFYLSNNYF